MPDQSSAATEHAILQEITAPLETLPDDPLAVVNADFPAALRGYDRLAVDTYVQQTAQLVAELQATRSPEAAVRRALERVGEQISGILQRAHDTAEEITAQSRREAEDRLEKSRIEAAQIVAEANRRVTDLDADTDRIWVERHRIVDDARELAQQLIALAETAAERFPPAETTPYEDAGPTRAPIAAREEATIPVFADDGGIADDEADFDDDPAAEFDEDPVVEPAEDPVADRAEDPVAEPPPSPARADEVEKTMAFSPLDAEPEPETPPGEEAGRDDREPADAPPQSRAPRRSNSVIPPASQAANRRSSR